MKFLSEINFKALIFGAAISALFIILGYKYWDLFYPFSAAGLLYAGYGQDSVKKGTLMGVLASTPIVVLTLQGYMGTFSGGFFASEAGTLTVTLTILLVGAFIGLVGAWAKRDRIKALEQYEKKQKIGKSKKKNKNKLK